MWITKIDLKKNYLVLSAKQSVQVFIQFSYQSPQQATEARFTPLEYKPSNTWARPCDSYLVFLPESLQAYSKLNKLFKAKIIPLDAKPIQFPSEAAVGLIISPLTVQHDLKID